MSLSTNETALRARLGIPQDARRVLVFSESSHWDTNWLQTSEEYFEKRLKPIFAAVLTALERDPQRVYCIESVFFLKLYWERHPEVRDRLRKLIENRQLRIVSSSFTTPDTLLPHPEAILRDFHLGQDWLRANGLEVTPRTAYFPDNFGHSPHLPSLMRSVGVDAVALSRIDGMYFIAADYRSKSSFPLQGSTAELLQKELKTLDFVWRADDGEEVLCHWNAFTYFMGDMLAHVGIVRWNGHTLALPWRTRRHIARRIDGFVKQLEPLARTPYLMCPIGMDFNDPIHDLRTLLDRYNRERYGTTGTWTLLAGLDDYFELLNCHREKLPVLSVDPNPYWMGFYSSRPAVKQRPTRIARSLVLAENLSAWHPPNAELEKSLREGWMNLVLINHHDAITGTSPDRIWHGEQRAWLDAAEAAADSALASARAQLEVLDEIPRAVPPNATLGARAGVTWQRDDDKLHVQTRHYQLTFSEARGGCLTSLVVDGQELLSGLGLDLLAFRDHGGLWRLGHEFRGGRFHEVDRVSSRPAMIEVVEEPDGVSIEIASIVGGKPFTRTILCRENEPFFQLSVTGAAARRLTITCRSDLKIGPATLEMDTVGGHIERPSERIYSPTFWPVPSLVSVRGKERALHASFEAPTAVSFAEPSTLEWIVARNAPKERAFGLLPVLAHPIGGTVDEEQTHHAALFVTPGSAATAEIRRRLERFWLPDAQQSLRVHADTLVRCDDPHVAITAIKRADFGEGVILRIAREDQEARTVRLWLPVGEIVTATRCDAREHDLEPLQVEGGQVVVPLVTRLTTVRLMAQGAAQLVETGAERERLDHTGRGERVAM